MTRNEIEALFKGRHPSTIAVLRHFAHDHLPEPLREVSAHCWDLAQYMTESTPDGPELTAGLRKLLGAKDCFVRAEIDRAG